MNKRVLLDIRINPKSVEKLKNLGFLPVFVPESKCLQKPVSAHPDMSAFIVENYVFYAPSLAHLFENLNGVLCDREDKVYNYPEDVMFNCAVVGKQVFCKEKYIHKNIKEFLVNNNYKIIDVKQGYAKCSVCVVSDNAVITEDDSIEQSAIKAGVDVLKIQKGFVKLDGYEYGFIGGASGLLSKNLLCFNGSIEKHSQYYQILDFCKKYNVDIVSLHNQELYDVGSIMVI